MPFIDYPYDDYELHQRRHSNRDELDILVADAVVFRPPWYSKALAHIGDGLIVAGNFFKSAAALPTTRLSFSSRGER